MAEPAVGCALYPIVYLDCIVLKVRHNKRVINKSMGDPGRGKQMDDADL